MITICTNDETAEGTLADALSAAGIDEESVAEIIETDGVDYWIDALANLGFDFQGDCIYHSWHGGRRDQFGYRCGLAHSDVSMAEAEAASDELDAALAAVIADWETS